MWGLQPARRYPDHPPHNRSRHRSPPDHTSGSSRRHAPDLAQPAGHDGFPLAPPVGFEPTTVRLKACCSKGSSSLVRGLMIVTAMRPSEVVMLRVDALTLPEGDWGRIEVTEADIDFDVSGETKTGERSVPIPPVLVGILRAWIDEHDLTNDDLIFRTRGDRRPTQSNWARALKRALADVGHPTDPGLRPPPLRRHHLARRRRPPRRGRPPHGPQRPDPRQHVRRRPPRRRRGRQRENRGCAWAGAARHADRTRSSSDATPRCPLDASDVGHVHLVGAERPVTNVGPLVPPIGHAPKRGAHFVGGRR